MSPEISWAVKGFMMNARIPSWPTFSPLTFSLKPVQRMTGMSGRTLTRLRASSIPDIRGMVWSVMTRSKALGSS